MKKVWYLSTCSTCKAMIKRYGLDKGFELQDIKYQPMSRETLEKLTQYYDPIDLFNKRARKAKELPKPIEEYNSNEILDLITSEYTFLNRPVIWDGDQVFVGNSKKTKEALDKHFGIDE